MTFQKAIIIFFTAVLALYISTAVYAAPLLAPLTISNIEITTTDNEATISWITNRNASGRIHFGTTENYNRFIASGVKNTQSHTLTLPGLLPDTEYHFAIISVDAYINVATSNDAIFKTKRDEENKIPLIRNVTLPYITGTTATITWQTDIKSSTKVRYGKTQEYNRSAGGNGNTTEHQVTLKGLSPATLYHVTVESQTRKGIPARWYDVTFRTALTNSAEKLTFEIFNVEPVDTASPLAAQTHTMIRWRTNKLADGWVEYGTSSRFGKRIIESKPDTFIHSVRLSDLTPDTRYYFRVHGKDIFGKRTETETYSFKTKPFLIIEPPPQSTISDVRVLGVNVSHYETSVTPHKRLVKTERNSAVYAIVGSKKHLIKTPTLFLSYGHSWGAIETISQSELNRYPSVTLIKEPFNRTVYFVDEARGVRKPIPTPSIFESYKENAWGNIVTVSADDLISYRMSYLVKTADGPTVYLVDYAKKTREAFADEHAFLSRGFHWRDIIEINSFELNAYTDRGMVS